MNLPNDYVLEMKNLLGEDEYRLYEDSLSSKSYLALRVNTSKISVDDFIAISPFKLEKIPFINNGFYIDDTDAASKHPYYFAGLYYLQEPSAMLPAANLNIQSTDKVLDLCAAPGGKATEVSSKSPALLIANDISFSRTIPLVKNLELFGAKNACVVCEDPDRLSLIYKSFFDKILVDAPCSGEGMFRKDSKLISAWLEKRPSEYTDLQKNILQNAVNMLSPGGYIVYSTCTFSKCEDEEVIKQILDDNPDISICPIDSFDGSRGGFSDDKYDFSGCLRIFPHLVKGEGHFICKLKKADSTDDLRIVKAFAPDKIKTVTIDKISDKARDFLEMVKSPDKNSAYYCVDDYLYLLTPEVLSSLRKDIHYSRTGVMVGQLKQNGSFTPATAFALYLNKCDFENVLDLDVKDERVIKYLKGETIFACDYDDAIAVGYVLICVNGFTLGFAKFDGSKYKNLYNPGWRLNG